jgi:hypothetical protein
MHDRDLLRTLETQFALNWGGIHGIAHCLDLGRVGTRPRADRLCTPAARKLIKGALARSLR